MALIGFASPVGGVGRTTLVANLAAAMTVAGRSVIALDLDPQNGLGLHFGAAVDDVAGLGRTLLESPRDDVWSTLLRPLRPGQDAPSRRDVISSYVPFGRMRLAEVAACNAWVVSNPEILAAPLRQIAGPPGVLVMADLPAGQSPTLAALLPLFDVLVIVLRPDATALGQLAGIEGGTFAPHPTIRYVLNKLDPRSRLGAASADAASLRLGGHLIGSVTRDEHVVEAVAARRLVGEYAASSRAGQEIADLAATLRELMPLPRDQAPAGKARSVAVR